MSQLTMTKRSVNGVVVIDLVGDICLGKENVFLKQTLRSLAEQGEKEILLNLADVKRVDSSGLGELVAGYAAVERSGGDLKLLHLSNRVMELMTITKLLTVFEVFEDEAAAVASFPATQEDLTTGPLNDNVLPFSSTAA